ncbi:MAG TPA: redoxin domain-containing protein, partial [Isosphaeraceae bacterium]|nr:redoxin domain-containing protein [Isosphaeraceae bacterium]
AGPEGSPSFKTLEALNAHFERERLALDRKQLDSLAALAAKQKDDDADLTYVQLFQLAIARNLYGQAERAADSIIASNSSSPEVQSLARFVKVVALADRGAFDESLAQLEGFVRQRPPAEQGDPDPRRADMVLAIGEAYLQRLIHAGRYDIARKVCQMAVDKAAIPAVKEHFARRLERLGILAQQAPAIVATDIDGRALRLADLRGKVVLVEFWATWCPPSAIEMGWLNALAREFGSRGFAIVGINLDGLREGAVDKEAVLKAVRKFLIEHRVAWPNAVNGAGDNDYAKAYGVTDVPANFLIGRDGKIRQVEVDQSNARRVIAESLGSDTAR